MNQFLKNFGILLIIIGVVLLAYYTASMPVGNALLIVSGVLIIGGCVFYIILNRIVE